MGETHEATQHEWILRESGLTIRKGDLIECEVAHQVRVATVKHVSVVGMTAFGHIRGEQVVYVQLYKCALPRRSARLTHRPVRGKP